MSSLYEDRDTDILSNLTEQEFLHLNTLLKKIGVQSIAELLKLKNKLGNNSSREMQTGDFY